MIDVLEPIFRGDWASYGEGLQCAVAPPTDAIPLVKLIDGSDVLRGILARQADACRCTDLRPVASAWCMRYLALLLPPTLAAATVLQRSFPLAVARMSVCLDGDGGVRQFYIEDQGVEQPGVETLIRYRALLEGHLEPLFLALARATRIPLRILWNNAARRMTLLFDEALPFANGFAPVAEDRARLLDDPEWPGPRANPLHDPSTTLGSGSGAGSMTGPPAFHRDCCLNYRLPSEGFCERCPLGPARTLRVSASA